MVTSTVDVLKRLTPLSETISILNVSLGSGTLSSLRKNLASLDVSSGLKETNFAKDLISSPAVKCRFKYHTNWYMTTIIWLN